MAISVPSRRSCGGDNRRLEVVPEWADAVSGGRNGGGSSILEGKPRSPCHLRRLRRFEGRGETCLLTGEGCRNRVPARLTGDTSECGASHSNEPIQLPHYVLVDYTDIESAKLLKWDILLIMRQRVKKLYFYDQDVSPLRHFSFCKIQISTSLI